jgi:hypothetical protein
LLPLVSKSSQHRPLGFCQNALQAAESHFVCHLNDEVHFDAVALHFFGDGSTAVYTAGFSGSRPGTATVQKLPVQAVSMGTTSWTSACVHRLLGGPNLRSRHISRSVNGCCVEHLGVHHHWYCNLFVPGERGEYKTMRCVTIVILIALEAKYSSTFCMCHTVLVCMSRAYNSNAKDTGSIRSASLLMHVLLMVHSQLGTKDMISCCIYR